MSAAAASPHGLANAALLVAALSVAGVAHVLWLKSRWARGWSSPIDGGATFRGRRLFGANKMLRGLVAMPLAAAAAFAAIGATRGAYPEWLARGSWDLSTGGYALLGFTCGLAFMAAELPNSFLKRQLDVAPGGLPRQRWLRPVCFVLDRSDSTLGVLAVVSAALPVSIATWGWMLVLGPASHAAFSGWLYRVKVKGRPL